MNDEAMTRFPVPEYDGLPADLQDRIDEETEDAGFTPNVFSAMAYKPSHFRAFVAYHDALVDDSTLEREEIEMLVVAVSGVNDCYYCVAAHGALLRIYSGNPRLAEQIATNHRIADVTETQRTMLDVAVKLTETPGRVDGSDVDRLREAGYSLEQIWDITAVVAFFNLSNRLALLADMRPNPEFDEFGR